MNQKLFEMIRDANNIVAFTGGPVFQPRVGFLIFVHRVDCTPRENDPHHGNLTMVAVLGVD